MDMFISERALGETMSLAEDAARATGPLPPEHPAVAAKKVGVLLINLGTPDGTDYRSMRRYLKEFLSDPRVIEVPKLVWWPILNGIILTFRPSKSGKAYEEIWNKQRDESPLRTITRDQAERLAARLVDNPRVVVDYAFRYGQPSLKDKIAEMQAKGCDRVLLAALYPQYSAATTATAYDKAYAALADMRWAPTARALPAYHDDPAYIDALARNIRRQIASLPWEPEVVVASYHGLPRANLDKGDPYHCHCAKTTRLLRDALGWDKDRLVMTFQSRFGPAEWLQPYTDQSVEQLAKDGVKRLAIVTPGFSADCVETLEEIAIGVRETFEMNGGEHFAALECLNASDEGIDLIQTLVRNELKGWVEI